MQELHKSIYEDSIFRCFNSIKPSQHLLDDIGLDPYEQDLAAEAFYKEEATGMSALQRILHRSEYALVLENISSKFDPSGWIHSRFSDGSWPVLYAAESEHTALAEKMFHMNFFYKEEAQTEIINVDLAIARLNIKTRYMMDLTNNSNVDQNELSSPDMKSYAYCQKIAKQFLDQGTQALRSFSARHKGGICIPVFCSEIIQQDFGIQHWHKVEINQGVTTLYVQKKLS